MTLHSSLRVLQQDIVDCHRCELWANCQGPVSFASWHWNGEEFLKSTSPEHFRRVSVLVVGEAPGFKENQERMPFVGKSGKMLESWLVYLGITDAVVTNTVKCYPHGTPSAFNVKQCKPYLEAELQLVQPRLVLAIGRFAADVLRENKDWWPRTVHLKHPSYYLHGGGPDGEKWSDNLRLAKPRIEILLNARATVQERL